MPCAQPMRSPSASITVTGSMPCHQKWLGSKLMPMFAADIRAAAPRSPPTLNTRHARVQSPGRPSAPGASLRQPVADRLARTARPPLAICQANSPRRRRTSPSTETRRASRRPGRPGQPAHRDDPLTPSAHRELDRRPSRTCASPRLAGSGCRRLPAALTAAEPSARTRAARRRGDRAPRVRQIARGRDAGAAMGPRRRRPARRP